ncbi:MAG: aminoacetone oxidase family FAD-binding enzyme [Ruminococcaceae bacterium]|nr:aminoacetone oxidase family FAD-binding enzyme [Oscillospiraceae bacterium]
MVTDVIIIGAGASGLCAAIFIKQNAPELSVRLLESQARVGKKLATTGNGRCNITNKDITLSHYHGENVGFCEYALNKYDRFSVERFFEKIGVPFTFEGDKGYPACLQAASVVDCMRFAAEKLGVILNTETKVTNIRVSGGNYQVVCNNMNFLCKNVIVAAGLFSGGEKLGADGSVLGILKKAGFKTVKTTPAIVQLKTETDLVKQLKGIKVDALVSLKADGKVIRQEIGETLFCDYGLSGPPVLQVARESQRADKSFKISLDLIPDTDYNSLCEKLLERVKNLSYLPLEEFFTGMLNKRLGQVIIKSVGFKLNQRVSELDKSAVKKLASVIKNFEFKVLGSTGFSNSQVTAGGLDTTGFDDKTMMSKTNKGFYAIGEILDIDGDCGGFNLQWAWSSAMCAADSIIKESKK